MSHLSSSRYNQPSVWAVTSQTAGKRVTRYFLQRSPSFCWTVTCFCVQYFLVLFEGVCLFVCSVFLLSGCCEEDISHECVILTMLLEVVLGIVFSFSVVTEESAANNKLVPPFSYNGISLPLQHVPYFLNNNKKLAKQCHSDPFCPFKVRHVLWIRQTYELITSNLTAAQLSCFNNRMHCRICLCVGVMRRTVTQESALAIQFAPELTLAGTVPQLLCCASLH